MDAMRDWGHAKDYVEMQWLMLQQTTPGFRLFATGGAIQRCATSSTPGERTRMDTAGKAGLDEKATCGRCKSQDASYK